MTADGTISSAGSATDGSPTGSEFITDVKEEVESLNDRASTPLTSVGGTADAITASFTPADATLAAGRRFAMVAAATNTGAVTLALNGEAAVAVKNDDGDALGAGQIVADRLYGLYFDGTNFRLEHSSNVSISRDQQTFTASGTWTKPAGVNASAWVRVQVWAAGGGGGNNAARATGGGGGGYIEKLFLASELGSSESVTIGAGGAVASAGGNSSFGSHLTAYGGGAGIGSVASDYGGGAGGSPHGAGGSALAVTTGASPVGRDAGAGGHAGSSPPLAGEHGISFGGGGGGAVKYSAVDDATTASAGGGAVWGGGGGGAKTYNNRNAAGGTSLFGGDGGDGGTDGSAPGGGGGGYAAGARGEVIVTVLG